MVGDRPAEFLSVESFDHAGHVHVRVRGELDCATAHDLNRSLHGLLAGAPIELVLDLSEVTFLGSHGVQALLGAATTAGNGGIGFSLAAMSHAVARTLEITGTLEALTVPLANVPGAEVPGTDVTGTDVTAPTRTPGR